VPLVDLPTAKLHLRVTHDEEDALLAAFLPTAEEQVSAFLNRNVYAAQSDLEAAQAAAPAALTTARAALDTVTTAALELASAQERDATTAAALAAFRDAVDGYERVMRGMLVTESVRTAILLITASLWEHRGDEDVIVGVPAAARSILWPFRTGIGV
jgi:hypothetical protein